jgi:hypothetical protein
MATAWRKSTRSGATGSCVEVAFLDDGTVGVRDSKDPHGPELVFTAVEWDCFIEGVYGGEFDLP